MPPPPPQPPPPPPPTTPFFTTILNQSPASAAPNTSANTNANTSAGANANANAAMPSPPRAPTAQPPVNAITSTQRSAQARNKPFGAGSGSAGGSGSVGGIDVAAVKREESYEERQRRAKAAEILSSVEMLIWWAGVRCESIPATRRHFQNILLGVREDEEVWSEEWAVKSNVGVGGSASPRGKARERERGKKRVVSASS